MAFYPSIQGFNGAHTANYVNNSQVAPDWANGVIYMCPLISSVRYVSRQNISSGAEEASEATTSYTHAPSGDLPITFDAVGQVYISWTGSPNGGGITRISGSTLAELGFSGVSSSNFPTGYPGLLDGMLINIPNSGTQFILASSIGGGLGILDFHAVFSQETFAGRQTSWTGTSPNGVACAGKIGSNLGYVAVGESGSAGTQILRIYQIRALTGGSWVIGDWPTQNSQITSTEIFDLLPTDIDAGWTEIHKSGLVIDQLDGNLIICVSGQSGATTKYYYIKCDVGTGSVIWKVGFTDTSGLGGHQMSYGNIAHQRLAFLQSATSTCTIINTNDGTTTSFSTGLAGVTAHGAQCYNDEIGAILLMSTFAATVGSPTQLNSTPSSYTGWSLLYVAEPAGPPAPSAGRKFLAELGPVQV